MTPDQMTMQSARRWSGPWHPLASREGLNLLMLALKHEPWKGGAHRRAFDLALLAAEIDNTEAWKAIERSAWEASGRKRTLDEYHAERRANGGRKPMPGQGHPWKGGPR